jgi:hypothetical protein
MGEFISGIILKSKTEIADGRNNSCSDLFYILGIEDNYIDAKKICQGRTCPNK